MDFISFVNMPLTPKESNFISQIGADILIRKGYIPKNEEILREIIFRAMLVKGTDVPEH
jgi:hypothetical protein